MKPDFVDNREMTMAEAVCGHLDWIFETNSTAVELSIATGYFNPGGFACLADRLDKVEKIRLLIGAEPKTPAETPIRMPGDPRGERFEAKLLREALSVNEGGLKRDRDRMPFTPASDHDIRRLLDFISTGKIDVKRYEKGFLHGKAFIFETSEGLLSGSSNFTSAGLKSNVELNLGHYNTLPVAKVRRWFEELWEQSVPYDLATIYAERFQEFDPYLIYLRVLWERYKDELKDEAPPGARIRLTTFQNDGIIRALRIIEKYNGVLIADGVGLGKTFIAGELIRQAVEDRRQRALLIAPATLRDGTWERFSNKHGIYLECISYEQLYRDIQLEGDFAHLKQNINDYALVVVDEAQAFRNPDTRRVRALRTLLLGHPPKKLILLSATPVNNTLWDLYYLLTQFIGHDAVFSDIGVRSLKERFVQAVSQNPDDLRPDALFDILDATTVRRTRHFVRRFYPNDKIIGPNGQEMPVQFPDPHVQAVTYSLDEALPGFFEEFAEALAPESGEPKLTLARYSPGRYRPGAEPNPSEVALVGLLRSGLLKRFESSVRAFALTARKMVEAHDKFIEGLERGVILTAEGIEEWEQADSDEALERLLLMTESTASEGYDVEQLKADVKADRELLAHFADRAGGVKAGKDPKLYKLAEQLREIVAQAEEDGFDEEDKRNKRKVLIFTYYADTAKWINDYLIGMLAADRRLSDYRGRLAALAGDESIGGISRERAVYGFVPVSSDAPAGMNKDLYDVMVTTDVLAEGVNLQQCRHIINFDLPWNPMRLVQRHGRIDRIGSPYRDVFIRCFFPDRRLDELLVLEERIRRKLAQAAAAVGVEHEVIPGAATSDIVFADAREEIEALRRERTDLFENAGEDPRAHSGEEYRQELRKGLEMYGNRIETLPWSSGSGFANGLRKGHFFCAKIGDRIFMRFIPWDGSEPVRDTLACLRLIWCSEETPRHLPLELVERAYGAWQTARRDIYDEWIFATDPVNLQPRVKAGLKAASEHLRRFPPAGISQDDLNRFVECLEAPWGARIEKLIREAMESATGSAASSAVIERIKLLGLQPYKAPEPLPPIDEEEVSLVCWMAVDSARQGAE